MSERREGDEWVCTSRGCGLRWGTDEERPPCPLLAAQTVPGVGSICVVPREAWGIPDVLVTSNPSPAWRLTEDEIVETSPAAFCPDCCGSGDNLAGIGEEGNSDLCPACGGSGWAP